MDWLSFIARPWYKAKGLASRRLAALELRLSRSGACLAFPCQLVRFNNLKTTNSGLELTILGSPHSTSESASGSACQLAIRPESF